jgi:hypothetical protein
LQCYWEIEQIGFWNLCTLRISKIGVCKKKMMKQGNRREDVKGQGLVGGNDFQTLKLSQPNTSKS